MCDCLVALAPVTADGVTLFAKNSDRPPAEPQVIARSEPTAGAPVGFLGCGPPWQAGMEHGVNDAGVAIGNEAIFTTDDPRKAEPGLTGLDLVRVVLERATSAHDGVDVLTSALERFGQGGRCHEDGTMYWSSFLLADPSDAWVVETSGRAWAAEQVTPVGAGTRAISNRTTIAAFDAEHRHPRQPVERLVDPRLRASQRLLAQRPVDVDGLVGHLRSHVGLDGYTVCMHVPGVEATTASMVAALRSDGASVAWVCLGSPCRSVYVPVFPAQPLPADVVPPSAAFAPLGPADRPALDALEASLARDLPASPDPAWNREAWLRVRATLETCASRSGPTNGRR